MAYRSRLPIGARINFAQRLTHGLLYLAPMSEGSGAPVDLVSGLPLTLVGSPVWVNGAFGKGLSLPGSDNIDISTPAMANASGNSWTWFTQYDFGQIYNGGVVLGYSGSGYSWYIQILSNGFDFGGSALTEAAAVPVSIIRDLQPHTLVFTNDNGSVTYYIDGKAGSTRLLGTNDALGGQATGKVWHLQGGYGGGFYCHGVAGMSGMTTDAWSAADVARWHADPNILLARKRLLYKSAGGTAYTLSPTSGLYTVAGTAAPLVRGLKAVPATGSYSVTGSAAPLTRQYKLVPVSGAYAITGNAASIIRALKTLPATGLYTITGNPATLTKSGGRVLSVATGIYNLTGNTAALTVARKLYPASGAISVTGTAAQLARGLKLNPATGSIVLTGNALTMARGLRVSVTPGSYNVTGNPITNHWNHVMSVVSGIYSVIGNALTFLRPGAAAPVKVTRIYAGPLIRSTRVYARPLVRVTRVETFPS